MSSENGSKMEERNGLALIKRKKILRIFVLAKDQKQTIVVQTIDLIDSRHGEQDGLQVNDLSKKRLDAHDSSGSASKNECKT